MKKQNYLTFFNSCYLSMTTILIMFFLASVEAKAADKFLFTAGDWGYMRAAYPFEPSQDACVARYEDKYNVVDIIFPLNEDYLPFVRLSSKSSIRYIGANSNFSTGDQRFWFMRLEDNRPTFYTFPRDFADTLDYMRKKNRLHVLKIFYDKQKLDSRNAFISLRGSGDVTNLIREECLQRPFLTSKQVRSIQLFARRSNRSLEDQTMRETSAEEASKTSENALNYFRALLLAQADQQETFQKQKTLQSSPQYQSLNQYKVLLNSLNEKKERAEKIQEMLRQYEHDKSQKSHLEQALKTAESQQTNAAKKLREAELFYKGIEKDRQAILALKQEYESTQQNAKTEFDANKLKYTRLIDKKNKTAAQLKDLQRLLAAAKDSISMYEDQWQDALVAWQTRNKSRKLIIDSIEKEMGASVSALESTVDATKKLITEISAKINNTDSLICSIEKQHSYLKVGLYHNQWIANQDKKQACLNAPNLLCFEQILSDLELQESLLRIAKSNIQSTGCGETITKTYLEQEFAELAETKNIVQKDIIKLNRDETKNTLADSYFASLQEVHKQKEQNAYNYFRSEFQSWLRSPMPRTIILDKQKSVCTPPYQEKCLQAMISLSAQLQIEMQTLKQQKQQTVRELTNKQSQLTVAVAAISNRIHANKRKLEIQVEKTKKQLIEAKQKVQKTISSINTMQKDMAEISSALDIAKLHFDESKKQLADAEGRLLSINNQLSVLDRKHDFFSWRAKIQQLRAENAAIDQNVAALTSSLNSTVTRIATFEPQQKAISSEYYTLRNEIVDLQVRTSQMSNMVADLANREGQLSKKLDSLAEELKSKQMQWEEFRWQAWQNVNR